MTAHSLFISDLHLDHSRPAVNQAFVHFLRTQASQAERLFILGDLFEYWAGDDDSDAHQELILAMSALQQQGCQLFLMHGNRDFLMGESFARQCHATLLPDPCPLVLYQHRVVLSHGDALCTDDVAYQRFRQQVRQADWQQQFLAQTLSHRKQQIAALREQSELAKQNKSVAIMDVNETAVEQLLVAHDYPSLLIHGHTHRPAVHDYHLHAHDCQRVVLGDWYEQARYLRLDASGHQILSWTW